MDSGKPEIRVAGGLERKPDVLKFPEAVDAKEKVPVLEPAPVAEMSQEEHAPISPAATSVQAPAPVAVPKDPLTQEIESVLEEDLEGAFAEMSPKEQERFKAEGERVAGLINTMMHHAKFSLRKVLKLVVGWLRMIPGVNRFFLDQEAKIKADKLLAIAEEEARRKE